MKIITVILIILAILLLGLSVAYLKVMQTLGIIFIICAMGFFSAIVVWWVKNNA